MNGICNISATICDFDKPTITKRKIIVLFRNLQKYSNFIWDAHIRHIIPPYGVFPHLEHISSSVYVPWRLNWMKPVELEGQKQGKTKLILSFCFFSFRNEKSRLFFDKIFEKGCKIAIFCQFGNYTLNVQSKKCCSFASGLR